MCIQEPLLDNQGDWHCAAGKLLGLFMADGPLTCCALVGGPGQAMVACGDESGTVHLLA